MNSFWYAILIIIFESFVLVYGSVFLLDKYDLLFPKKNKKDN